MRSRPGWFAVLVALVLVGPGAARAPDGDASILGLELDTRAADVAVARALRTPGRGPADARRAARLFDLAQALEELRRDDLALRVHRAIVDQHPTAEMPSGVSGTTFAEESRARIDWLAGDRSWLAPDFRALHRRLVAALAKRDPAAIAALAPPWVRVGPFRACPDGWRARKDIAHELTRSAAPGGGLELDGPDQAWFRLTVAGGASRVIVMGLTRDRAEWQAYCYEEVPEPPALTRPGAHRGSSATTVKSASMPDSRVPLMSPRAP